MRRTLALCLALCAALPAYAVDYHVSALSGRDNLDGRAATMQGGSGPFATLRPLQGLALQAGDRILLGCGERFAGPLRLTLALGQGGMVTLAAEGACAHKPVIDGREALGVSADGQRQSLPAPQEVAQVFAGDLPLPQARHPAVGLRILPGDVRASADRLPDAAAFAGRALAGARLHARTQEWFVEEHGIADNSGRLTDALRYPLRAKTGYVLTGKAWMLGDAEGWAWDASEGRLHLRAAAGRPLSVVRTGPLVAVLGRGSLLVQGIALDAAGGDALQVALDGTVRVDGVDIRRASGNGVAVAGARQAEVSGSIIEGTGLDGVFFAEAQRVVVRGNVVRNAGSYAGLRPALAAINAHRTDSAIVEDNVVERSAYHGIRFAGDARIRRNTVSQSCLLLSDCAAIYTWRRNADDRRPHADVTGNVIMGVQGDTAVKLGVNDWFVGIYLDDFSSDISVEGNVVAAVNQGIYLHNAQDVVVRSNVVAARQRTLVELAERLPAEPGRLAPNRLSGNDEMQGDFDARLVDAQGRVRPAAPGQPMNVEVFAVGAGQVGQAMRCEPAGAVAGLRGARMPDGLPVAAFNAVRRCR